MDADVPLAEVIISGREKKRNLTNTNLDISLKWKLTGWGVGRMEGRFAVNYYNRDLSALEPAIEPFL